YALQTNFAIGRHLVDDDREDGGGGNGEDRAHEPHQRAANEQRDEHCDGADTDALLHDLRDEHVGFELVQYEEVYPHHQSQLRRDAERDSHGGDAADDWPDNWNRLADGGDERHHIEVRYAHREQADSGEGSHHAGQHELRAQPGADLHDGFAHRL